MIRIGIQIESPAMAIGPELEPADRQRGAQRDPEEQHREGPDDVEHPRQHRVDPAAVVAGEQADDHREQRGDGRGRNADVDRRAAAVHQPDHDVAAVLVRAEQVLAVQPRPDRGAVGRDDVGLCAVDRYRVGDVVLVRPGLGDVFGPQRRSQAEQHDQDEQQRRKPGQPCCAAAEARPDTRGYGPGSAMRARRRAAVARRVPRSLRSGRPSVGYLIANDE